MPMLAACGNDDADPTSTAGSIAPTVAPTATSASPAQPAASPTTPAAPTATHAPAPATATALPATPLATATADTPDDETTIGPFTVDDLLMGKQHDTPRQGGTLIDSTFGDISTLLPIVTQDTSSNNFQRGIMESLVTVHPDTLEPIGLLAESWTVNAGATEYTVRLRSGIAWSDGQPFTAADVKFSYDLYMNEATGSPRVSDMRSKIDSVEVIDDHTVVFHLKATYVDWGVDLGTYLLIAKHIWEGVDPASMQSDPGATGTDPSRVIGTGPFLFDEWVINDHATLVRNPNYWNGVAALDRYILKVIPDQNAGVTQFRTGEIDLFFGLPESAVEELTGDPNLVIADHPTLSFTFYGLNQDPERTPLFQDIEVRQALMYAIDRQALIDAVRFGYGEVAVGTMPVLSWAYNPDGIDNPFPYDPDRARQLLADAGWADTNGNGIVDKDGQELSFTMYTNAGNVIRESYLVAIQAYWSDIGVEMTPTLEPFPSLVQRITSTFDFEAFLIGYLWNAAPDQSIMFSCDAAGGNGFNVVGYCNPQVDALLEQARTELDRQARIELYTAYQNIVSEEQAMSIIDFQRGFAGLSTRVHNVFPSSVNTRWNMQYWWVEE